ncbi:GntR family transcriptional regulator [Neptunomonas antarctica]|uniref:Transcriptional regulator, GntR family n=1 Tax=Neptunomonas antarctica TaxID=619304 RepID=A0A1N7N6J9_9GAMM|nr:GntR family transcriptional regulator [Neptunomonas antarctica]SIS93975.1 transcriptional regulator, GntR family [Neptunomonas antarctica]
MKIVPKSIQPMVLRALEQDILTGILKPSEKLDESILAKRFGVSRTPIREALLQLKASGLVDIQPRRGASVMKIELKTLFEMFETMAFYEATCAKLAARRAFPADIERIRDAHESSLEAAQKGDIELYFLLNIDFHEAIYSASRNKFLEQTASKLNKRLSPYRHAQLHCFNRVAESHAEHLGILVAIEQQDGDVASLRANQHISVQGGNFADFIARLHS